MPPKYTPFTPVIFRMLNGECIALFPTLAGDMNPRTCQSYMHMGQHGSASIDIGQRARLATWAEYMPLKKELTSLGYKLRVVKRISSHHNAERRKALGL